MEKIDVYGSYHENHFPGRKSKATHPYSYDPIVIWKSNVREIGSLWTDRLWRWDPEKHDLISLQVFGNTSQYWYGRSSEDIEKFLRLYLNKPKLKLASVVENCNQSTGFPVWYLSYGE